MSHVVRSEPELPITVEPTGLEAVLRKDWSDMKCFSCGKSGHSATRCPTLDVSFPFILPGWKAEKTPTISSTTHRFDPPDCSVYLLIPCKLVHFHNRAAPPHTSDRPVLRSPLTQ